MREKMTEIKVITLRRSARNNSRKSIYALPKRSKWKTMCLSLLATSSPNPTTGPKVYSKTESASLSPTFCKTNPKKHL